MQKPSRSVVTMDARDYQQMASICKATGGSGKGLWFSCNDANAVWASGPGRGWSDPLARRYLQGFSWVLDELVRRVRAVRKEGGRFQVVDDEVWLAIRKHVTDIRVCG